MQSNEIRQVLSQNAWFASLPDSLADKLIERGKFSQQLTASLFLIVAALGIDCVIF